MYIHQLQSYLREKTRIKMPLSEHFVLLQKLRYAQNPYVFQAVPSSALPQQADVDVLQDRSIRKDFSGILFE